MHGAGIARGVENYIEEIAIGLLLQPGIGAGIRHSRFNARADRQSAREATSVRIDEEDVGTGHFGEKGDTHANSPRPHDEQPVDRGDGTATNSVHADRQKFHHRRLIEAKALTSITASCGTDTYSAMPPSMWTPMTRIFMQQLGLPNRQA